MLANVIRSEYSDETKNTVYKETGNLVLMEQEKITEKSKWSVTRAYMGMFSCEEAVKKLFEIHANTEEEE